MENRWTEEHIKSILDDPMGRQPKPNKGKREGLSHNTIIWRMLDAMMTRQAPVERALHASVLKNHVGFNAWDAPILHEIHGRSKRVKRLDIYIRRDQRYSDLSTTAYRLKRYAKQLEEIAKSKLFGQPEQLDLFGK